ncbi:MAG TPA: Rne/Rng family ribonuclease [Thermodesulfobacteriota bacterium]
MESIVLINVTYNETRVAVIENGLLAELYLERKSQPQIVGNIYKGKVGKIVPGMQAAFIELGLEKSGFISAEDVHEDSFLEFFLEEEEPQNYKKATKHLIQDVLREGQEVLVQVLKESVGGKGAKLSSYIALPGKYLVFLGTADLVGISRRIEDKEERKRLSDFIKQSKPKGIGFIARTASMGKSEDELRQDMEHLMGLWTEIKKRSEEPKAPMLLYEEPSLNIKTIRDLITNDVKSIIVDSSEAYQEISNYLSSRFPGSNSKLELYSAPTPLFLQFGVESEIKRIFEKKVWLKSGGYLIIEETEALTVMDINTGKYLSGDNHDDTIFDINIEAASEAARQIRLRNLVGIIVIDFIDMKTRQRKEEVFQTFAEAMKKDKARSVILDMSPFGVVQMTRQRVRESLLKTLAEPCGHCGGIGYEKSKETASYEIIRELKVHIARPFTRKLSVYANPDVVKSLKELEQKNLNQLEQEYSVEILLEPADFKFEDYKIKVE